MELQESCRMSAADVNKPLHLIELKMFKIETNCREAVASQVRSGAALPLVSTGVAYSRRMCIQNFRTNPNQEKFQNCDAIIQGICYLNKSSIHLHVANGKKAIFFQTEQGHNVP
jgi:hypothetical protein